jgi:hypothetical protein
VPEREHVRIIKDLETFADGFRRGQPAVHSEMDTLPRLRKYSRLVHTAGQALPHQHHRNAASASEASAMASERKLNCFSRSGPRQVQHRGQAQLVYVGPRIRHSH